MSDFVPIHGLHHYACRCRDAEETRRFYQDILGLPLVHIIRAECDAWNREKSSADAPAVTRAAAAPPRA